jgi:hypothetical protein
MTMRFVLKVQLGNAAMTNGDDVADMLEAVATQVRSLSPLIEAVQEGDEVTRTIRDANGNRIGSWVVDEN